MDVVLAISRNAATVERQSIQIGRHSDVFLHLDETERCVKSNARNVSWDCDIEKLISAIGQPVDSPIRQQGGNTLPSMSHHDIHAQQIPTTWSLVRLWRFNFHLNNTAKTDQFIIHKCTDLGRPLSPRQITFVNFL